ncbi:MAG: gluconokinase [Burkholderiaceae bacterium]
MSAPRVVVMGVSGCGKSALGERLARALGLPFVEGDTLHPPRNIERMARGIALTDADRAGWLDAVAAVLASADGVVVACSALKRRYRDRLRAAAPDLHFVHLHGAREVLEQRMAARTGHYMPASLLQSQLDALEPPGADESATSLDLAQPLEALLAQARRGIPASTHPTPVPRPAP